MIRPLLITLAICGAAAQAHAQDRFEIQVYDSETAEPGSAGLELHLNEALDAQAAPPGEVGSRHVAHLTLEPHLGLTRWCEIGGYFQLAIRPDQGLDYAGVKLRFKMRYPGKLLERIGLALNTELSRIPARYEADRWGGELRPAIDARWGRFYASLNPILSFAFAGEHPGEPELEPAGKVSVDLAGDLSLGAEYYGGLGPVTALLPGSEQTHWLFAAADWTSAYLDLNAGVGRGLAGPEKWIVKAIIGVHPRSEPSLAANR